MLKLQAKSLQILIKELSIQDENNFNVSFKLKPNVQVMIDEDRDYMLAEPELVCENGEVTKYFRVNHTSYKFDEVFECSVEKKLLEESMLSEFKNVLTRISNKLDGERELIHELVSPIMNETSKSNEPTIYPGASAGKLTPEMVKAPVTTIEF